jgi:hypothetical protein
MKINLKIMLWPVAMLLLLAGCKASAQKEQSPQGYNLSKPEKFLMPESLFEISGLCFYKNNSDTVYAIQDEEGKFFRIAWGVKKQDHSKFGKKGDYEDVTIVKDRVYVLKSNGSIYSFPFADRYMEEIDSVKEWKKILPEGEYEGMFGDDSTGKIYIICKKCADDDSKEAVSGYIYTLGDSLTQAGSFHINVNDIKTLTGKVKRGFRPSALAKNPVNGYWYVLSSVNKLLIVTDSNWKLIESIQLSGNRFNQPEGINFDKEGNMYISNEGDDLSQGNILKFKFTRLTK